METPRSSFGKKPRRPRHQAAFKQFRDSVMAAVAYEYRLPRSGEAPSTIEDVISDHMDRLFMDSFYVHRPLEEERLSSLPGRPRVIAVVGERGSGKTTLLRHFTRNSRPDDPTPTELASTYGPIAS